MPLSARSPRTPESDGQALGTIRAQALPVETELVPLSRFLTEPEEPEARFPIAALVSEVLSGKDAVARWKHFPSQRDTSGLTLVLVEEDAWERLLLRNESPLWPQGRKRAEGLDAIESRPAMAIFEVCKHHRSN